MQVSCARPEMGQACSHSMRAGIEARVDALFRAHTIEELKVIERNTKSVR